MNFVRGTIPSNPQRGKYQSGNKDRNRFPPSYGKPPPWALSPNRVGLFTSSSPHGLFKQQRQQVHPLGVPDWNEDEPQVDDEPVEPDSSYEDPIHVAFGVGAETNIFSKERVEKRLETALDIGQLTQYLEAVPIIAEPETNNLPPSNRRNKSAKASQVVSGEPQHQLQLGDDAFECDDEDQEASFVAPENLRDPEMELKIGLMKKKLVQFKEKVIDLKNKHRKAQQGKREALIELEKEKEKFKEAEEDWERQLRAARFRSVGPIRGKNKASAEEMRRKRDEARRKLFMEVADIDDDEEDDIDLESALKVWKLWKRKLYKQIRRYTPFAVDLRTIEARYGSSVASYFFFSRWIILQMSAVLVFLLGITAVHILRVHRRSMTRPKWLRFTGIIPWFWQISSFEADEAVLYTATLLCFHLGLLVNTFQKMVSEDKRVKEAEVFQAASSDAKYAKLALNAWDFALTKNAEVSDLKFTLGEQIVTTLHEDALRAQNSKRSTFEKVVLYTRRLVGFLLVLLLMAACFAMIMYMTAQATTLEQRASAFHPALVSVPIVPTMVSVINAALPPVITVITALEKWDSEGVVKKMLIGRLWLAKIFNVLVQLFSFILLLDPQLFTENTVFAFGLRYLDIRQSAQKAFLPKEYDCQAEQLSSSIFVLVATEFVISKLTPMVTPKVMKGVAQVRKTDYIKPEFDVAQKMVGLLYFQALIMLAFPLAPLSALVCGFLLYLNFKHDKWILMTFQQKPKKPWSAKDAGNFFIKFYFLTVLMSLGFTVILLQRSTMSKNCQLQDAAIGLCLSPIDPITSICAQLDQNNPSYEWFSDPTRCDGYPRCICNGTASDRQQRDTLHLSCGPYTSYGNGFLALVTHVRSDNQLNSAYSVSENPWGLWALLVVVTYIACLRGNSLHVSQDMSAERESMWKAENEALEKKIKRHTKKIEMLQKAQQQSEADE